MATVYLAARYTRREELCGYKADLEARGHRAPARWLLGDHQIDNAGLAVGPGGSAGIQDPDGVSADEGHTVRLREKFAVDDFEDVVAADLVIAFTQPPRTDKGRGGRHVELGIALGRGTPVIVVGPRENIFCCLPQVTVYPDWSSALDDPRLANELCDFIPDQELLR